MTPLLAKTLAAGTLASLISVAPAFAGGSLSITLLPTNQEQDNVMRAGLAMYSIVNGIQKGGGIKQKGFGNAAGVLQNGFGNHAVVHQEGNGHNGSVRQNGHNNAHGLFQFGQGTDGHVVQNGNGRTGTTFQFGW